MQEITTLSMVIIAANAITGITAAGLFLLIFWENPHGRINQFFALTMAGLVAYAVSNITSRLSIQLELDPRFWSYLTGSFYLIFVVSLFLASVTFAGVHTRFINWITVGVIFTAALATFLTWGNYSNDGVIMDPDDPGGFKTSLNSIGYLTVLITFLYPLVTTLLLFNLRNRAPRLRTLWRAPGLAVLGILWLLTFWQSTHIPLNALFLAGSAFVLGRAVLFENLFNPLADLSEELQEKNTELHEADRIKNQFLAKMSHELRTPLNSIIGYTDLILDGMYGNLTDQQQDRLEKVLRNGRNLLNLINDILDLSHIEVGQITLTPESINTNELLESVLAVVEPQVQEKQLRVIRDFENAPPIFADRTRAKQIVTNILSNAVKFTHKGYIRVQAIEQNGSVLFQFEDTGIGIPADKMERVFEEFRQIDNTTTREYGGTGLGMSITKRLVEMSGGKIWLESQPNQGTTFFIVLPSADAIPEAQSEDSATVVETPASTEKPLKILVIDDKHDSQMYMYDILNADRPHWEVIVADSGREGLQQAETLKPDVITLDIMMPSMDGWEVLKILKSNPKLGSIPVIIVSLVDNYTLAYKLGAAAIVPKPIDRKELIETIAALGAGENIQQRTFE